MIGWRGSGRGTSRERIQTALLQRGVDTAIIEERFGPISPSVERQSINFYEESQRPQDDDDSTPVKDSTPVDDNDSTPVDDNDSTPWKDMTPDEDDPKDEQPVQEFEIGSNVLARWEPRKWYLAHVTGWKNGRYNVYFMCGSTKINMSPDSIRPFKCGNPPPRRGEMLNKTFHFSEDEGYVGLWKVRRIEGNGYVCTRLTGGDGTTKNMETFDIGRVIREYLGTEQTARELGPCSDLIVQGSRRRPRRLRR